MINEKLLLRNKKIADYSLKLCEKIGVSKEYDGKEIYSFLLLFNADIENVDFSNEGQINSFFNKLKFRDKNILSVKQKCRHDYLDRILDVINLSILHFDKDGNEINILQKMKELNHFFGNYQIYKELVKTIKYYYPDSEEQKEVSICFSDIFDGKLKSYEIKMNVHINEETFKDLILYLLEEYVYIDKNELTKFVKRYLYVRNISYTNFYISEKFGKCFYDIKEIIDNNIDVKSDLNCYSFDFSVFNSKEKNGYKWAGYTNINIGNVSNTLAMYYQNGQVVKYKYFLDTDDIKDIYSSSKEPQYIIGIYSFKRNIFYLLENKKEIISKIR